MKNYEYKIIDDYVEIYLENKKGQKFTILLDVYNLNKFLDCGFYWNVSKTSKQYYVTASEYISIFNGKVKAKTYYLHRFLVDAKRKTHVDHKSYNTLDNRISNLRVTNTSNNNKNRGVINSNNKTGYRNVCQVGNRLYVQLQIDGKNNLLKTFNLNQLKEAGEFAKKMRWKYYGDFSGIGY